MALHRSHERDEHKHDESKHEHEHAVKAAHEGYAQATAKAEPELPVDFATLFHCASNETLPWPKAVQEWADKSPANQHVLDEIHGHAKGTPAGVSAPLVQTLINEVLKAVNA